MELGNAGLDGLLPRFDLVLDLLVFAPAPAIIMPLRSIGSQPGFPPLRGPPKTIRHERSDDGIAPLSLWQCIQGDVGESLFGCNARLPPRLAALQPKNALARAIWILSVVGAACKLFRLRRQLVALLH